ncbi:DUF2859 domain-containing protein, partial [Escherichia coli]|nr:DUF2859 domain-containing protein [Escherichia coli]MBZ8993312.1 DUF2859 domain-containing protein [Escherichia coli]MBZ8998325.1 DUF2859 domain-containing protein [Escherichia coli]MBZ9003212.1 DUF2859 domain-containing protein [Escherichia coli]MBZ9008082.1 DUF2859 domain-containing protein [Escherichia coli]
VNVADESSLRVLRELAPGVVMVPASGSVLARRLQISHYPVLITDNGLSQVPAP